MPAAAPPDGPERKKYGTSGSENSINTGRGGGEIHSLARLRASFAGAVIEDVLTGDWRLVRTSRAVALRRVAIARRTAAS